MLHDIGIKLAQVPGTAWTPIVVFVASVLWSVIRGAFTRREDWRDTVDEELDTAHDNFIKIHGRYPELGLDLKRPKR